MPRTKAAFRAVLLGSILTISVYAHAEYPTIFRLDPDDELFTLQQEIVREYYRRAIDWITHHPADAVRLTVRKLARLFSPLSVASYDYDYPIPFGAWFKAVYAVYLLLALAGALWCASRWRGVAIFYTLVLQVLVGTVLFYGDARYSLPMVPSMQTFASFALVTLCDRAGVSLASTGGRQ